jgi:hypothetical protein
MINHLFNDKMVHFNAKFVDRETQLELISNTNLSTLRFLETLIKFAWYSILRILIFDVVL